jgi:TRAP-type C4-dicarboxylate transport system permease small subunit
VKKGKLIDFGIPILCGMLLMTIVSLTFLQIVLRQFFNFSLNWSDEISQFCLTWLVLFGSVWATKHSQHLNAGIKLHRKLHERQIHLIDGVLSLVIAFIAAMVAYQGAIFATQQWALEAVSLGWVKLGYVFVALPFAMLVMSYYYFKKFLKSLAFIIRK